MKLGSDLHGTAHESAIDEGFRIRITLKSYLAYEHARDYIGSKGVRGEHFRTGSGVDVADVELLGYGNRSPLGHFIIGLYGT